MHGDAMPDSILRLSPGLLEQLYLGAVEEDELKPLLSELARSIPFCDIRLPFRGMPTEFGKITATF